MSSFIRAITRAFVRRRSRVRLTRTQWRDLIDELGRRAGGVREAGAFLLAHPDDTPTTVRRVVFFDDVDPECMTGSISMSSSAFDALWGICSREHLRVIADVHTHPGTGVGQSSIDRANPMVAVPGHVAIIVPHLAAHAAEPEQCGVHVYHGNHDWSSNLGSTAARLLYIGRWA